MTMTIKPTTTVRYDPNWLTVDLLRRAGELALREQTRMIQRNRRIDGSPQKVNAPSTLRRKALAGRPAVSLVDEFKRFVSRNTWGIDTETKTNTVRVHIVNEEAKEIAGYLQGKRKIRKTMTGYSYRSVYLETMPYTGWIGVTESAKAKVAELFVRQLAKMGFKQHIHAARASR